MGGLNYVTTVLTGSMSRFNHDETASFGMGHLRRNNVLVCLHSLHCLVAGIHDDFSIYVARHQLLYAGNYRVWHAA